MERKASLDEIIIIHSSVELTDDGDPYPWTRVYRYEIQSEAVNDYLEWVGKHPKIVEGGQMSNE